MSDSMQVQEDLHFVRSALARRGQHRSPAPVLWTVAIYVLIGYPIIDFAPQWAGWFFGLGSIPMWGVLALVGRRQVRKEGEYDRKNILSIKLHWFGGIALAGVFAMALAIAIPALRGVGAAQVMVVMMGLVYFLGGVHFDRQFLWLGPVVMLGGVGVGFLPHYGWTSLGAVIALGLVIPTFFKRDSGGEVAGSGSGLAAIPA